MRNMVFDRLMRRELGLDQPQSTISAIYGDRKWVRDLDIVNELDGHTGCVNALSWSKSGRLLASGSDDHRINIHSYHPDSSTSQFSLTTSILTGHQSNIFSVKFMPFTNDRTIVSATDDVRIFDIEHSGHSASASASSAPSNRRRRLGIHGAIDGVTLTEGDTNAKAFRCHSDTVKRIVTENSPFYFLTCSEDGDVRQWDIRQPSNAYPPSRDGYAPRFTAAPDASDNVPAPLISYKRYQLDLNTVSCSPSQPHYIALGGAHLHCFLHDRRMLGRDKLREKGQNLSNPNSWGSNEDELLGKATQCVRRFAPNGQKQMGRHDNGHITACKISDANPNELIVSWSGDWIYGFDITRSPDAEEGTEPGKVSARSKHRVRNKSRTRKRKRAKSRSSINSRDASHRVGSRQRTESSHASPLQNQEGLALRVLYENGQSEEIPIEAVRPPHSPSPQNEQESMVSTDHFRIAKTIVNVQKNLFGAVSPAVLPTSNSSTGNVSRYNSILGFAASTLPEMDDIERGWRYPVNPDQADVVIQNRRRAGRQASRRFLQAAGTLARVLGGHLHTGGDSGAVLARYFTSIHPVSNERSLPRPEQFGYDFLKAILLWLDSGLGAVVEGFSSASTNSRFPLSEEADVDAIHDTLVPYLLHLASDNAIVDVDTSRFESDETRVLFSSEKAAVLEFARSLRIPFADLTGAIVPASGLTQENHAVQDRKTAVYRWAFKVGRGVLLNASKGITFANVDRSFGGLGRTDAATQAMEETLQTQHREIDPLEPDDVVVDAEVIGSQRVEERNEPRMSPSGSTIGDGSYAEMDDENDPEDIDIEAGYEDDDNEIDDDDDEDEEDSDGDIDPEEVDDDEDDDDDDDDDEEEEEAELLRTRSGRILWRSDFYRRPQRERVELDVPCSSHTRMYMGHCNVRTVKDVNFFGLDDEYVVSGSDCGHVFIWDRKTSQLVNILKGDGETVNVIQGHPYEPTMAVSGIDHTIKIFSPDARAQYNARKGVGVRSVDPSSFSSLTFGRRRLRRGSTDTPAPLSSEFPEYSEEEDEDVVAANGLSSRKKMGQEYQITSGNDQDRRGGNQDAFITRALLAQLAQRVYPQGEDADAPPGEGGGPIYVNEDNCEIM